MESYELITIDGDTFEYIYKHPSFEQRAKDAALRLFNKITTGNTLQLIVVRKKDGLS